MLTGLGSSSGIVYKVERYNDNSVRIIRLYKNSKNNDIISNDISNEFFETTQEQISLSRTKRNIRRICLSNAFEYFATWTIDSKLCDRYSLTACVDKMKELLKAFQRKYNDFKYIYVIEKHEKGGFHFHGLIKGVPDSAISQFKLGDKMSKAIADKVRKGYSIYHIPFFDDKLGYNTFTKIVHYDKCCNYIIKYISKDSIQTTENQRYFCSRGLSKGESYEVKYIPYELFDNQRSYDYHINGDKTAPVMCTVRDLNLLELKRFDLLAYKDIEDFSTFIEDLKKILKIKKDF